MIAILDYGSGNLRSAQRAFALTGHDVLLTSKRSEFLKADAFVVPGVGAYGACMKQLEEIDGRGAVSDAVNSGKPIFGICVGMQILFTSGSEKGKHLGLGYFPGDVSLINAPVLPHIGWNDVNATSPIFHGVESEKFYFVHSYAAKNDVESAQVSWTTYGERFVAAISKENIFATQFHPEKSGDAGAKLIENWAKQI
ncbi:MAG: imidazole glycerol phosphate synthase subunit HisH [Actinomycetes bacterium]